MFENNEQIDVKKDMEEDDDFDYDRVFKEAEMLIKKEVTSDGDEDERPSEGSMHLNTIPVTMPPYQRDFSEDFTFIRSCLKVVLKVDDKKRHHIVREISLRIKMIESLTSGKNALKAVTALNCSIMGSSNFKSEAGSIKRESPRASSSSDSDTTVQTRTEMTLISNLKDGRSKCNVCNRIIINAVRKDCCACSSFAYRLRIKAREEGEPLPKCKHHDFSGRAHCKSCRYRMYTQLMAERGNSGKSIKSRRSTKQWGKKICNYRSRGKLRKCRFCEKESMWFRQWRCSACFAFHSRLIARFEAGDELPTCEHGGSYAGVGCKGCRIMRLQKEAIRREPKLAAKLPLTFEDSEGYSSESDLISEV